jgi:hypothetical protein
LFSKIGGRLYFYEICRKNYIVFRITTEKDDNMSEIDGWRLPSHQNSKLFFEGEV